MMIAFKILQHFTQELLKLMWEMFNLNKQKGAWFHRVQMLFQRLNEMEKP